MTGYLWCLFSGIQIPYWFYTTIKNGPEVNRTRMLEEDKIPCRQCMAGLHRVCSHPVPIPTLVAFIRGRKDKTFETLTCCDRKEFWTQRLYP